MKTFKKQEEITQSCNCACMWCTGKYDKKWEQKNENHALCGFGCVGSQEIPPLEKWEEGLEKLLHESAYITCGSQTVKIALKSFISSLLERQYDDFVGIMKNERKEGAKEIVSKIRRNLMDMNVKLGHADECLATKFSDSYCDCSDYISNYTVNQTLENIDNLLTEVLKEYLK